MRLAWIVVLALASACEGGKGGGSDGDCVVDGVVHELGEVFPAGDGCNTCSCTPDGVACTERACPDAGTIDADPASCAPSGVCPEGPECGAFCCGRGELCAGGTCVCGSRAACGAGDACEAAGPIGQDACGSVCCGASGPCPQ